MTIISKQIEAGSINKKSATKDEQFHPAGTIKCHVDFSDWSREDLEAGMQASAGDHMSYGMSTIYRNNAGEIKALHDYGRFKTDVNGVFSFNPKYRKGSRSGHPKAIREAIESLAALGITASEEQIDKLYHAKGLKRNGA